MRVVSLLPSATEIVAALGQSEDLIARSHACDMPPAVAGLPVLTAPRVNPQDASLKIDNDVRGLMQAGLSVYDLDAEGLRELAADVVLTQSQCDLCAVSIGELQAALKDWSPASRPQLVSLEPLTLKDIYRDIEKVGAALEAEAAAQKLVSELKSGFAGLADRVKNMPRPRVLFLDWTDPIMGGGHWIPELIENAGGVALGGEVGADAKTLTLAEVIGEALAAAPDIILIAPCGFDLPRGVEAAQELLAAHKELAAFPIYVADGNLFFNRPSPSVLVAAEIVAEIINPALGIKHQKHWKRIC